MTAMAKKPEPQAMSEAQRKLLKGRFNQVMLITTVCCFTAFAGVFGHVNLHAAWGLPLFGVAMVVGFGVQIAFIVGLVKASRQDKDV
jgi:hypothetical protein